MVGRPIARHEDDGLTVEINRTCTNGQRNANSMLYGASRKAAWAMGYRRCITYTQKSETGASLRAADFILVKELKPRKNWKQSSGKKSAHVKRDDAVQGNVTRYLWECRRGA